jgi:hypothetical protein
MPRLKRTLGAAALALACACGGSSSPTAPGGTTTPGGSTGSTPQPIWVVLFTHIEDNTPAGTIPSGANRTNYLRLRETLIETAQMMQRNGVKWSLQPDWKFLEAAVEYENGSLPTTGSMNVLQYLKTALGVAIDPHSHENGGYNYSDVAYLLDRLGAGGSTVIGGHIWDPSLPQFQEWDRFRSAVSGEKYPSYSWRGDILMGAGTPGHTNDPVISGVWRPASRSDFFTDSSSGNITSVGAYRDNIDGVSTLYSLYAAGTVSSSCMLTATYHITPGSLTASGGVSAVERDVVAPFVSLKAQSKAELTDFTTLVSTWRSRGGSSCTYRN